MSLFRKIKSEYMNEIKYYEYFGMEKSRGAMMLKLRFIGVMLFRIVVFPIALILRLFEFTYYYED